MGEKASRTWQELSGSEDWTGLLEPQLDEELRMYLLQYGERGQAIADAFNGEDASPARGYSRYPMDGFFPHVGLELSSPSVKYEVTQFIYAKEYANILLQEVNWIAYVAVSTDEGTELLGRRDILVVWRPTWRSVEVALDIDDTLTSAKAIFGDEHKNVMVHEGWLGVYTSFDILNRYTVFSARNQVLKEVKKQIEVYKNRDKDISITVVGHSMGGALATLNAMDIVANGHNLYQPSDNPADQKACQVTVFAFASPKVGDQSFKDLFDTLNRDTDKNIHALRIFNAVDVVPNLPPVDYVHVGEQLMVDCRKSRYLKPIAEAKLDYFQIAHQLEPLLHVVSGWKGKGMDFDWLTIHRDLSLANKDMDALGPLSDAIELLLTKGKAPASWWVVQNKGMVAKVQPDGKVVWTLEDDYKPQPPQF